MTGDLGDLLAGGGGAAGIFGGIWLGLRIVKYLRNSNGKAREPAPPCPAERILAGYGQQATRCQEAFRGLCHSLDTLSAEVRGQGENGLKAAREHREAVTEIVRMALKKEE